MNTVREYYLRKLFNINKLNTYIFNFIYLINFNAYWMKINELLSRNITKINEEFCKVHR